LAELRRAAAGGAFGGIISSSAQLRTQLLIAEIAARRLQETLVVPCKNKRYMLKFLDESSGGQD